MVNEFTGEVAAWRDVGADGSRGSRQGRPPAEELQPYGLVYLPRLADLSRMDLSGAEARLLFALMARAPLGECLNVSRAQLARDLDIHRNTIDRAWTSLIDRSILRRDPDDRGCIWLDPDLFWRGQRDEHQRQRRRLRTVG